MKAHEPGPDIATALTVSQFCQMFCITPELYAALKRTGQGPREVHIGTRTVIPLEYAAQWLAGDLDLDRLRAFDDARLVLVASWLAEQFMKSNMGLIMNIVLGIVGAAIASAILSYFGIALGGWVGYLVSGFIGAVLLIWIVLE